MTDLDARPRAPRRRGRRIAVVAFVVVLLAVLAGAVVGGRAVVSALRPASVPDYPGPGTGEVLVQVQPGDTAARIGATLREADVVKSVTAFTRAAVADERSRSVQPGFYRLRVRMSGEGAVALLLDPESRARSRVALPEGLTLAESLQRIAEQTTLPLDDLTSAARDAGTLGLPGWAGNNAEGFLFPATYDVEPGTSAAAVLRMMTARFAQAADAVDLVGGAGRLGRTPYEVLITASLVEKETAFPADRPKVARVVYNRLAAGMPLQFDSTVNYSRTDKKLRLSLSDLEQDSAYNTYRVTGLPPTPIAAPGRASLEAALQPEPGDFLYFVATGRDGSSLFTSDYRAFLAAKAKAQAEGIY